MTKDHNSTESLVALAMAKGIRRKLSVGPDQAYVVAAARYIDGQPPSRGAMEDRHFQRLHLVPWLRGHIQTVRRSPQ